MKVLFKNIEEQDLEMIRRWRNSKRVSQFMYSERFISETEQIAWYRNLNKKKNIYKIFTHNGIDVGMVYLTEIDHLSKHCRWGIYIGNEDYLTSGIGIYASYELIQEVFGPMKFNKLMSMVLHSNKSAIKLNSYLGFQKYGIYKDHCLKQETYHDMYGYELTKEKWEETNKLLKNRLKL